MLSKEIKNAKTPVDSSANPVGMFFNGRNWTTYYNRVLSIAGAKGLPEFFNENEEPQEPPVPIAIGDVPVLPVQNPGEHVNTFNARNEKYLKAINLHAKNLQIHEIQRVRRANWFAERQQAANLFLNSVNAHFFNVIRDLGTPLEMKEHLFNSFKKALPQNKNTLTAEMKSFVINLRRNISVAIVEFEEFFDRYHELYGTDKSDHDKVTDFLDALERCNHPSWSLIIVVWRDADHTWEEFKQKLESSRNQESQQAC